MFAPVSGNCTARVPAGRPLKLVGEAVTASSASSSTSAVEPPRVVAREVLLVVGVVLVRLGRELIGARAGRSCAPAPSGRSGWR